MRTQSLITTFALLFSVSAFAGTPSISETELKKAVKEAKKLLRTTLHVSAADRCKKAVVKATKKALQTKDCRKQTTPASSTKRAEKIKELMKHRFDNCYKYNHVIKRCKRVAAWYRKYARAVGANPGLNGRMMKGRCLRTLKASSLETRCLDAKKQYRKALRSWPTCFYRFYSGAALKCLFPTNK